MADVDDMKKYYDKTHFMEIVDVDLFATVNELYSKGKITNINYALPLHIIRSSGINVERDFDVKVTDLNTDEDNLKYKQFTNSGDGGVTFKVDVLINTNEKWGYGIQTDADYIFEGRKFPASGRVTQWLNFWYVNMRPLYVVSKAIDIPHGVYLITKNSTRKQTLDNHTVWTLEFSSFNPLLLHEWTASQSVIDATTPTTTNSSSKANQLKDCTADNIVYSTSEKKTDCNKLMQEKLYKLGFLRQDQVDGWYGPITMGAVKKFQKWYNSKGHNLLVDGDCGPVTLKALVNS